MQISFLKHFIVPGSERRVEVDFLRGIAIFMVMGNHFIAPHSDVALFNAISAWFKRCGGQGVDLFFVLSGFLVGGLLLKEYRDTGSIQATRFLLRRGLKIWPAFYFLLLVHALLRHHSLNTFLWQNAFHVQNYFGTSIAQTWSLAIEEHFYLAVAFLLSFLAARRFSPGQLLAVMGGICLTVWAVRIGTVLSGNVGGAGRWTHTRIDSLMFGVAIATMFHLKREWYEVIASKKLVLRALSVAVFALIPLLNVSAQVQRIAGYSLFYVGFGAFLILVYEHSGRWKEWLIYRLMAWLGPYSYGIYLWHSITLGPARKLAEKIPNGAYEWPVVILFQIVVSVTIGVVLTHLVEWPFLRWRDKHMGTPKSPLLEPSVA